jgi:hypothetical protein
MGGKLQRRGGRQAASGGEARRCRSPPAARRLPRCCTFASMPLPIPDTRPTVFVQRQAFEREQLERSLIDARFNLTDEEFRVEGNLIMIGPLPSDDMLSEMIAELEMNGLRYFDDFFELSGNWPEWLRLFASAK